MNSCILVILVFLSIDRRFLHPHYYLHWVFTTLSCLLPREPRLSPPYLFGNISVSWNWPSYSLRTVPLFSLIKQILTGSRYLQTLSVNPVVTTSDWSLPLPCLCLDLSLFLVHGYRNSDRSLSRSFNGGKVGGGGPCTPVTSRLDSRGSL